MAESRIKTDTIVCTRSQNDSLLRIRIHITRVFDIISVVEKMFSLFFMTFIFIGGGRLIYKNVLSNYFRVHNFIIIIKIYILH